MKNLQTYKWNFGCLPMQANIKPRVIILTVQNTGGTDLNWNFKLPSDSQIEVEPWADPGEPTAEEAFEKTILEKKIFEIKPKSGFLQPGQLADI
jgi:cilia- and flagella-associated protein 65